jgi:hypothetical protein
MHIRSRCLTVLAVILAVALVAAPAMAQKNAQKVPQSGKIPAPIPKAIELLSWDDGTIENGLGVNINANYDGQIGTRFGGSPTTTGLIPMRLEGGYWRMFSGFAGATNININFWTNFAGMFPTNLVGKAAGNTNTTSTQYAAFPGTFTVTSAAGSVMVGVGVNGTNAWFVAGDTNNVVGRNFFGAFTTEAWTYGPGTLASLGLAMNHIIRLLVDGNIPVELESFDIQ